MEKCNAAALLLAGFAALAVVVAPTVASARIKDSANVTYCKSGAHVTDSKQCKENGGKN